jgi:hypothetical protein
MPDSNKEFDFTELDKVKKVKVKTGNRYRIIYVPSESIKGKIKSLLEFLYKSKLNNLVSPWACAYVRGKSIVDAAKPHVGHEYVFKVDLKNFFENITYDKFVYEITAKKYNFMSFDYIMSHIKRIEPCFIKEKNGKVFLPPGFATSPILSNIFMGNFDWKVATFAKKKNINYTRYADDIILSGDNRDNLQKVISYMMKILYNMKMEVNKKKIRMIPCHKRQMVCGLVVNKKINLPKTTRKLIRAIKHNHRHDQILPPDIAGLLSYENMVKKQGNTQEAL